MTDEQFISASADETSAPRPATMTVGRVAVPAVALTATIGLAGASWVIAIWRMNGMDMGVATQLGSFAFFVAAWVPMMAAMMLPGLAPAVLSRAQARDGVRAVPLFVVTYLAVWTLVGLVVYATYSPHGPLVAGAIVIVAGGYELTPLKRHFRQLCRERARTGFGFGLCCLGSNIGLMLLPVALGIVSLVWMAVVCAVVIAQRLLPPKAAVDVLLGVLIIGFGLWIVLAPSTVPGLMPSMPSMPSM